MNQKYVLAISVILMMCGYLFFDLNTPQKKIVCVYNWSNVFPPQLLKAFEAETGIKVIYDVYDSNEVLEAKLFMGNSGYDVVFPSTFPFAKRQVKAGIYHKIDKNKVPNIEGIHGAYFSKIIKADPKNEYIIPLLWGMTGLIYNVDKIKQVIMDEKAWQTIKNKPFELIFNRKYIAKLAPMGVSLLLEYNEVFAPTLLYLNKDMNTQSLGDIEQAFKKLMEVRPYISQFQTYKATDDLLQGNIVIAQLWSGQATLAINKAKKHNISLVYAYPKQGPVPAWIDCVAIPRDAPHLNNAYKFINFILRPENLALISITSFSYNAVPNSVKYLPKDLIPSSGLINRISLTYALSSGEIGRKAADNMRKLIDGRK